MAPPSSEIIKSHSIGNKLDEYCGLYDVFISIYGHDMVVGDRDQAEGRIRKQLLQLLGALQTHPICYELHSSGRRETLFGDLAWLSSEVDSKRYEISLLLPLLKAIRDKQPDRTIWEKVYDAVTESTPPPHSSLTFLQTPLSRKMSSITNSNEYRKDIDRVLKDELGHMFVGLPIYEKFFEDIEGLDTAAGAVFEMCKEGEEPLYSEESGWKDWPADSKEGIVLDWLRSLVKNFIKFFQIHAPNREIERVLIAWPNKPVQGSTAQRKIDIGFVDESGSDEDTRYHWSRILVPGELKNDPGYDTASQAWLDLGRYVREVLAAQDSRSYVLGFTLCGPKMRLWEFDSLGGIASEQFDINEKGLRFVSVVLGFLNMTKEQLGFDPTVIEPAEGPRYIEIDKDGQKEKLIIEEVVSRTACVSGRATTIWKAHLDGNDSEHPLVIKDSWQYPEREEEGELLKEITKEGVKNVTRYYHHETVRVTGSDDDIRNGVRRGLDITKASNYCPNGSRPALSRSGSRATRKGGNSSTSRKRSSTSIDPLMPPSKRQSVSSTRVDPKSEISNRVHRRVVVQDYGKPIYKASSRVALLEAFEGCIEGYEDLYNKTGLLQGDISPNNLMVNEDPENPSWKAFLIDLDLAIRENRESSSGARGKTGTLAFMAIGVLLGKEDRSFMHDLESFFWVLYWICIHYERPGQGKTVPKFDKWNYMPMDELAEAKIGVVAQGDVFNDSATKYFTEYFQPLVPWVNKLRRVVFPDRRKWKTLDQKLGSSMRSILREARSDPDVMEVN
ncbi:hypothetical protein AJ78_05607 [Emergomyces pasteurianus Ep9510]|uniref:Fungal-type protein kinase domain-containing protein n=1 Tax=Emergomyces pasteurianus Ep9510 TaxID=1447872 RepID=A0A1J9PDB2_9EURO|nr:hypothetical protein AJ78_05607 [Emergomyces pasteurianus Ep9510]